MCSRSIINYNVLTSTKNVIHHRHLQLAKQEALAMAVEMMVVVLEDIRFAPIFPDPTALGYIA
jgi:hypothetical protein